MKYIIGGLVVIAAVLLIVFWKPISAFFSSDTPADGTPCTDASGRAGTYTNGVCTAEGGPAPIAETRLVVVNTSRNTILLPSNQYNNCHLYTSSNPYKSNGCSYVFGGYTWMRRIRFCVLKKVSCP